MTAKYLSIITKLAHETRQWAEKFLVKELNIHGDLMCGCSQCSCYLHLKLKEHGIKSLIIVNGEKGHCFLTVDDYIVDVTATQFGDEYDKVEILKYSEVSNKDSWIWNAAWIFDSIAGFKSKFPKFDGAYVPNYYDDKSFIKSYVK